MPQVTSGNSVVDARFAQLLAEGVQIALFGLPFNLGLRFVGEVGVEERAGQGAVFVFRGDAELSLPFGVRAPMEVAIDGGGRYELRFPLPDLKALLDRHVRDRLGVARATYDLLVAPYLPWYRECTVIVASHVGDDPELGGVLAGCNFYSDVRLADIEPTRGLCRAFPAAGLDDRRLVLHLGCVANPVFQFVVEGNVILDAELGTPAAVLDKLVLRVDQDCKSLAASAAAFFTLRIGGEALVFIGALGVDNEAKIMISGSLDAKDGAWAAPFGARGLTIVGLGVQITGSAKPPYVGLGLRGGVRVGGDKMAADVALLVDLTAPEKTVLQIVSDHGFDLRRLLAAVVDPLHLPPDLASMRLDDLVIYISPNGGVIAGKEYSPGFALRGDLELWGLRARVDGALNYMSGGSLRGTMSPLRYPGDGWLATIEGEPGRGPTVEIDFNPARQAARVAGAATIVGAFRQAIEATIDPARLHVDLRREALGIYGGGALEVGGGRLALTTTAGFRSRLRVVVGPARLELDADVVARYRADADPAQVRQTVDFTFDACGESLELRASAGAIRFAEVDDLARLFVDQSAQISRMIALELMEASLAAIAWLRGYVPEARDLAIVLRGVNAAGERVADGLRQLFAVDADTCAGYLRSAPYAPHQLASAMKVAYTLGEAAVGELMQRIGMSAKEIAGAMHQAFEWSAKRTAAFCDETLKISDKATKSALEAADYSSKEIKGAMSDVFGWSEDLWESFTGLF